ncbi:hypothetical protein BDN67DRAFT_351657 [Paxillus ammoniavirescens]|nr:hypothetical protein BDN67DRAFT_351657 [Paxillus ammoniavirescens]
MFFAQIGPEKVALGRKERPNRLENKPRGTGRSSKRQGEMLRKPKDSGSSKRRRKNFFSFPSINCGWDIRRRCIEECDYLRQATESYHLGKTTIHGHISTMTPCNQALKTGRTSSFLRKTGSSGNF